MQYPSHRPALRVAAALLAIACTLAGGGAAARHRNHSGGGEAGEFDYYLLSLSWSPAYCLDSPGAAECTGPRRFGFIVHGLWPQGERDSPEHCDVHRQVPDDVVDGIGDLIPARSLVYHEWSAHGTCSGLEPAEFFQLVRRARAQVTVPGELATPGAPTTQSTDSLVGAFLRANPRLPAGSVLVTCSHQDVPRLREVRVCLNRDLSPRPCGASALRGACRADQLVVPPVR
jgi:ribonuclease T2